LEDRGRKGVKVLVTSESVFLTFGAALPPGATLEIDSHDWFDNRLADRRKRTAEWASDGVEERNESALNEDEEPASVVTTKSA